MERPILARRDPCLSSDLQTAQPTRPARRKRRAAWEACTAIVAVVWVGFAWQTHLAPWLSDNPLPPAEVLAAAGSALVNLVAAYCLTQALTRR